MSKILQDVFENKGDLRSPTNGDLFHFFDYVNGFFSIKKKI
jgi:hypothetical protein